MTAGPTPRTAYTRLAPLVAQGMVLDLASMRHALGVFGHPEVSLPCVHIAGTNGKGSVSAMVDAALRAAGVRSGMFTSPHLHRFVERFRIGGVPACETDVLAAADAVMSAVERGDIPQITFFEATTLVAWLLFQQSRVAFSVMEVGLGGRLDATNVCIPRVTAITRIALEHTALLGNSLEAIAREKAGILKPGVACVLGPDLRVGAAREAITKVAESVGATLCDAPSVATHTDGTMTVSYGSREVSLRPSLRGGHQAGNVAVAAGVCTILQQQGVPVDAGAFARGVASVTWPARMELLGNVLIDAAHNPDGVDALLRSLPIVLGERRVGALVFGASGDKAWRSMLDAIIPWAPVGKRYFGAAEVSRAVPAEVLADYARGRATCTPSEALSLAREALGSDEVALVCGSMYYVAGVRAALLGIAEDPRVAL